MNELREIKLVTDPGYFLLLVTPPGVYQHRVMDDDTIVLHRGDEEHTLRLPRAAAFFDAMVEFYVEGDDTTIDEFRDRPHTS
jgi:hypothetical protein